MKMSKIVLLAGLAALFAVQAVGSPTNINNGKRVVCYLGTWAVYRYGIAAFSSADVDPSLCTHLIYAFVGLDQSSSQVVYMDDYLDNGDTWKKGMLNELRDKARAVGTKYMVAIGGWNEGSEKYSDVICNDAKRAIFASSVVALMEKHNMDGFDLDWEYPGLRGGSPNDRECYSKLLKELRPVFDRRGWELSAAVSANAMQLTQSYDVPVMNQYLNFINVMSYDLHGSWESKTGFNAALNPGPSDLRGEEHLCVAKGIQAWIELGANPEKLNLGVGSYGRSFTLADPSQNGVGAPTTGDGPYGISGEAGFYGYTEICNANNSQWTFKYDTIQDAPYAYSGNKWVGFDDQTSIRSKTCWAKANNVGGMMMWSIETDDPRGLCKEGKYPLLHAIWDGLADSSCGASNAAPPTATSAPPASTSAPPTTTSAPPATTTAPVTTPTPTTSEPATDAQEPAAYAPEPATDALVPATDALQPAADVPQPATDASEPAADASEPAADVPQPAADASEPAADVPQPAADTPGPGPGDSSPGEDVGSVQECGNVGQMIRDSKDCSAYYVCTNGLGRSLTPTRRSCAPGLYYDDSIQNCNYPYAVKCNV